MNDIPNRLLKNCQLINDALKNSKFEDLASLLQERDEIIKELLKEKRTSDDKMEKEILKLDKENIKLFEKLIAEHKSEIESLLATRKGLDKYKGLSETTGNVVDWME